MEEVVLSLHDIQKSFGENHIHRGITLDITKGKTVGLLGPSGAGKSVLLRSIIGLEFIDDGEIRFKGERIDHSTELEFCEHRKKISYSFQSGALFDSQNVFDNLAFPLMEHTSMELNAINGRVQEVLKLIDLEGKEDIMPSALSGGMQKRVGMARAIILEPDIILYDEPTAGLDPTNTQNILNVMQKLKAKGITSIFVTHDIPAALKICDEIAILNKGKVAFKGTPNEVLTSEDPIVKSYLINEVSLARG